MRADDVANVRAALAEGVEGVRSRPGDGLEQWHHPVTDTLHRLNGPASVGEVRESWYVAGVRHRVGGPAEVTASYERWWQFGAVHRLDGPATTYKAGGHLWVVNGRDVGTPNTVTQDWDVLDGLYDAGERGQVEQILTLWSQDGPAGPSVLELAAAVMAAHA